VRLSFEPPLAKGQPVTVTFYYDGKLTGQEESPVFGVRFAAIHPDFAYLMYPSRWFPVAGYTTNRFASDFRITVPDDSECWPAASIRRRGAPTERPRSNSSSTPSFPAASRW